MATGKALDGKPYAGNPHVRFDEGEVASAATSRRGSLLYKKDGVRAVIELRITPQRDCGFGKIAERVSRFEQVEACFLMSGGYDLLVFVKGDSLQDVAQFVAADLSTIDGVLSTATHFMLETYKAGGVFDNPGDTRLEVS